MMMLIYMVSKSCNAVARALLSQRVLMRAQSYPKPGSSTADSCLGALAWFCVLTVTDMRDCCTNLPPLPCFCPTSDVPPGSQQMSCTC